MAKPVQRQITLTQEEDELIQDAVRQALGDEAAAPSDEERAEARQEWEQVMALMRARARLPVPAEERMKGRGWTREELYDERFDRFAR